MCACFQFVVSVVLLTQGMRCTSTLKKDMEYLNSGDLVLGNDLFVSQWYAYTALQTNNEHSP
jgi:hypothetical protein